MTVGDFDLRSHSGTAYCLLFIIQQLMSLQIQPLHLFIASLWAVDVPFTISEVASLRVLLSARIILLMHWHWTCSQQDMNSYLNEAYLTLISFPWSFVLHSIRKHFSTMLRDHLKVRSWTESIKHSKAQKATFTLSHTSVRNTCIGDSEISPTLCIALKSPWKCHEYWLRDYKIFTKWSVCNYRICKCTPVD